MISKKIVDSGAFLDMPLSTQCLYFHLNMRADDEGVVDNARQIMKMIGANEDDIKMLIAKSFLLIVEGEVVVIKDWYIHNTLQKDRVEKSLYHNQLSTIYSINDKKQYTNNGNKLETNCNQNVSIDKYSIDKNSIDNNKERGKGAKAPSFKPPTVDEIETYCKERNNNVDPKAFYDFYESKGWMIGKNKMKDWKAAVRTWEQRQINKKTVNQSKKVLSREEYNKMFQKTIEKQTQNINKKVIKDTS